MNKIIILGHPTADLAHVERLLNQSGMQACLPSRREGLLAHEITETLCEAHQCGDVERPETEDSFEPIAAGTVWHGLALDLMLGNLGRALWGWSDSRVIYWLNYWASLDPHATFLMVYSHPMRALQAAARKTPQKFDLEANAKPFLNNWQAYNSAMLRFYSKHPERCLLVNAGRAREQLNEYLEDLNGKLHGDPPAAFLVYPTLADNGVDTPDSDVQDPLSFIPSQGRGDHEPLKRWFQQESPLEQYLLTQYLTEHPQATQLYHELESACTVYQSPKMRPNLHPGQAWLDLMQQRHAFAEFAQQLIEELRQRNEQVGKIEHAEIDLLLAHLNQVQEELERCYLRNQELEQTYNVKRIKKTEAPKSLAALKERVHLIEQSRSWRITSPIRAVTRVILRKQKAPKPLSEFVSEGEQIQFYERRLNQLENSAYWRLMRPYRAIGRLVRRTPKDTKA